MSGAKIIEGLKAAIAGDFRRVTIDGQVWVRQDAPPMTTAREVVERARGAAFNDSEQWRAALLAETADQIEYLERLADGYEQQCIRLNAQIAALQAALDEAVRERDKAREACDLYYRAIARAQERLDAAESRLRAYESGDAGELVATLEKIARFKESYGAASYYAGEAARALRAADARERKAVEALEPFAHAVFNDNGDCTVYRSVADHDDFIRAYFVHRRLIRARTATGGSNEQGD